MKLPRGRIGKKALIIGAVSLIMLGGIATSVFALLPKENSKRVESEVVNSGLDAQAVAQQDVGHQELTAPEAQEPATQSPTREIVKPAAAPVHIPTPEENRETAKSELYAMWTTNDYDVEMWECFDKMMARTIGYADLEEVRGKMTHIHQVYASFCAAYMQWYQAGQKTNFYPLYGTDRSKYVW